MALTEVKRGHKNKRRARIRNKVFGTRERPRLSVYRSNANIYAQLIDDEDGHTIVAADSREVEPGENRVETSRKVGELVADRARSADVGAVVFDRGGNMYHGRVAALADGARSSGLKF
ncbi:MAG: 50S ribosomal protein L18 [Rubrobacter sp.]|nr:50S ribosomal protein L18 [Rubrobacter sp.]